MFNLSIDCDTIFFRPEAVTVTDGCFYGDADAYLILENAEVLSAEFLGRGYLLGLRYNGHRILAESQQRPHSTSATLYIRKTQMLMFKDGLAVK